MDKKFCKNEVKLVGRVVSAPCFHHKCRDKVFASFSLSTLRLSGTEDIIPIIMINDYVSAFDLKIGDYILVEGEYRSYNSNDGKLLLNVYGKKIVRYMYEQSFSYNKIDLEGYVCKKVEPRTTPKGKVIMDIMVAVNRAYNKSDYIPCLIWYISEEEAKKINLGDKLVLSGRIQSREYKKVRENGNEETKTAYEVSINEYQKE